MIYTAHRYHGAFLPEVGWSDSPFDRAQVAQISHFRPESSPLHRPEVSVKMMVSTGGLHGIFKVEGERVRCTRTRYFDDVWKDSCVEFFVQPRMDRGYFNFEFNCGGAFLCSYVTDPTRTPDGGLKALEKVSEREARAIRVHPSLPPVFDPQATEPLGYTLTFFIPLSLFTPYVGAVSARPGERWSCNFYKCAEDVANPHWASWSPVDELNFHLPRCFGHLEFE